MRAIRLLGVRRIRRQPLRAAIIVVAVAAGTALALAIQVLTVSVDRSARDFGRRLAGPAPLRVVGPTSRGGLDQAVLPALTQVEGVARAVPLVQALTRVDGIGQALAVGVDCRVEAFLGELGCTDELLAAAGDRPLAVGPGVPPTAVRANRGRVPLDGVPVLDALGTLGDGRVVVFSLAASQRLFAREGRLDAVYVEPTPGTPVDRLAARLSAAAGEHNEVLRSTDPPPMIGAVLSSVLPLFSILGIFALGTGAVLVANTVGLSLEERRRQLAVLASLGASRRTLVASTLAEVAVLGAAGGLLGALGGVAVAGPITRSLGEFTRKTAGIPLSVHVPPSLVVVGILLGTLVSVGAAVRPTRRALRVDVAAELSERDVAAAAATVRVARRLVLWTAASALAVACIAASQRRGALDGWQPPLAVLSFLVLSITTMLAGAALAPLLARIAVALTRGRSPAVRLGAANLVREPGRTGVVGAAVASAVLVAFISASFTASARRGITESVTDNLRGLSVSSVDPTNSVNVDSRIPPGTLWGLATLPEVDRVLRGSTVLVGQRTGELVGIHAYDDPWLRGKFLRVLAGTADRRRLEAGEVVIGAGLARREGLRPGDRLPLDTPTGRVEVPIQGVWEYGDFGGHNVLLSYAELERLYGPQSVVSVTLEPAPGVSLVQLRAAISRAGLDRDLVIHTPAQLADRIADDVAAQMASFWTLQRGLLFVAFVAVLSTLLLAGIQRRRELGLLGAVGMEPGATARMVVTEAAVVAVIGVAQSVVFGVVMLWALLQVVPLLIGFRDPFVADWGSLVPYGAAAVAIAVVAAVWPAWRAARTDVVAALAYE